MSITSNNYSTTSQRFDRDLLDIEDLIVGNPEKAEQLISKLITNINREPLEENKERIQILINQFLHKRQRRLTTILQNRLDQFQVQVAITPSNNAPKITKEQMAEINTILSETLDDLSQNHIFQWSSHYRLRLGEIFSYFLKLIQNNISDQLYLDALRSNFLEHTKIIFDKGYAHKTQGGARRSEGDAIDTALNGLRRFMEIPLEIYSFSIQASLTRHDALAIRSVTSSMLCGILEGFGNTRFGLKSGWQILPAYPRGWAHYLVFLSSRETERVVSQLEVGQFRRGLNETVVPTIMAIESVLLNSRGGYYYIPDYGRFVWDTRRFDLSLVIPRSIDVRYNFEIQCYTDQSYLEKQLLDDTVRRGVGLIVAPFRADLFEYADNHTLLRDITVNTTLTNSQLNSTVEKIKDIINNSLETYDSGVVFSAPLQYNFARDFPLYDPYMQKFFRVHRESVRKLLRTFESSTGIRLWCSMRRSGKTTACFDLTSSSSSTIIVPQTCTLTDQYPEGSYFYERISDILERGRPIPRHFVSNLIGECSNVPISHDTRVIFLLDEYETLFERLALSALRDRELRYTVVQPLLDQIVGFSKNNLVVFVGQQPDSHYILMDQNQLSAYIQQDDFPLFQHTAGADVSEFRTLAAKVLTDRVQFDSAFCDGLFYETGGHPFITVNVLVELFEWLIEQKRPARSISLTIEDLDMMIASRLTAKQIRSSQHFQFFKHFVAQASSEETCLSAPWLYSVIAIIRRITLEFPQSMSAPLDDVLRWAQESELSSKPGCDPESLLSGAQRANFLVIDNGTVRPKVLTFGRIVASI